MTEAEFRQAYETWKKALAAAVAKMGRKTAHALREKWRKAMNRNQSKKRKGA